MARQRLEKGEFDSSSFASKSQKEILEHIDKQLASPQSSSEISQVLKKMES